jgi:2-hydroxy-3-keto-5-methylthiopentenyl-1-phosphate phosphatase
MKVESIHMSTGVKNLFNFIETPDVSVGGDIPLSLEQRRSIAVALTKDNFANKLALLPLPEPGSPLYDNLEEIKTTHIVYEANKKADEAWMKAMVSEDPTEYGPALRQLDLLKAQVNDYYADVVAAQSNLETDTSLAALNLVRERYQRADERFFATNQEGAQTEESMIERVATRLTEFSGVQASSDLDLTITSSTWYLALLPHFLQFENFMGQNGREALPFVMARYAKEALVHFKDLYEKIGGVIPLRHGVIEFFKMTKEQGIPVSILSANFRAIVAGCLEQIPVADRHHLLEVTGLQTTSLVAANKDITTAQRVVANPDFAHILCLDGLSDEPCLRGSAEGTTAAFFVLEDSPFIDVVKESGQPYFTYKDFNDINRIMLEIIEKKKNMQAERIYA